jgi:hypothetical protein
VLLADDHAVLRAGLKLLLSSEPDMEVCGEAASDCGRGPRSRVAARCRCDDLRMNGTELDGVEATRIIAAMPNGRKWSSCRCTTTRRPADQALRRGSRLRAEKRRRHRSSSLPSALSQGASLPGASAHDRDAQRISARHGGEMTGARSERPRAGGPASLALGTTTGRSPKRSA